MSRAAVAKVRGWKAFTVEEFLEAGPSEVRAAITVEQLRPLFDEMVDRGYLKVTLVGDELRYRIGKMSAAEVIVGRVAAMVPDAGEITQNVTDVATVGMLLERARDEAGVPFPGLRRVAATREELEAARDELVEALRCLNLPTARHMEANVAPRAWAEEMLREVRRALRDLPNHLPAPDTLCVTCRSRERHFGPYCKRCCPPDQRPTGKVT